VQTLRLLLQLVLHGLNHKRKLYTRDSVKTVPIFLEERMTDDTYDIDYGQPSDAEVLSQVLPGVLEECVVRIKFKNSNSYIFATLMDNVVGDIVEPLEQVDEFMWIWNTKEATWQLIPLSEIDNVIDVESLRTGETEYIDTKEDP